MASTESRSLMCAASALDGRRVLPGHSGTSHKGTGDQVAGNHHRQARLARKKLIEVAKATVSVALGRKLALVAEAVPPHRAYLAQPVDRHWADGLRECVLDGHHTLLLFLRLAVVFPALCPVVEIHTQVAAGLACLQRLHIGEPVPAKPS